MCLFLKINDSKKITKRLCIGQHFFLWETFTIRLLWEQNLLWTKKYSERIEYFMEHDVEPHSKFILFDTQLRKTYSWCT